MAKKDKSSSQEPDKLDIIASKFATGVQFISQRWIILVIIIVVIIGGSIAGVFLADYVGRDVQECRDAYYNAVGTVSLNISEPGNEAEKLNEMQTALSDVVQTCENNGIDPDDYPVEYFSALNMLAGIHLNMGDFLTVRKNEYYEKITASEEELFFSDMALFRWACTYIDQAKSLSESGDEDLDKIRQNYNTAIEKFNTLILEYPDTHLKQLAYLKIASCYEYIAEVDPENIDTSYYCKSLEAFEDLRKSVLELDEEVAEKLEWEENIICSKLISSNADCGESLKCAWMTDPFEDEEQVLEEETEETAENTADEIAEDDTQTTEETADNQ